MMIVTAPVASTLTASGIHNPGGCRKVVGTTLDNSKMPRAAVGRRANKPTRDNTAVVHEFVSIIISAASKVEKSLQNTAAHKIRIELFSVDEMIPTTQRAMETRRDFIARGKPSVMDFGYHYTRKEHLDSIRAHGLLNTKERAEKQISVPENGTVYGTGVYTASSPYAYHGRYGDVCLLVARLPGTICKFSKAKTSVGDSLVIVKQGEDKEVMVLSTAAQCIPILCFDASTLDTNEWLGNATIDMYHLELLNALDSKFNTTPAATPSHFSRSIRPAPTLGSPVEETIHYVPHRFVGLSRANCFWVDCFAEVPNDMPKCCRVCGRRFRLDNGHRLEIVRRLSTPEEVIHLSCGVQQAYVIQGKMPSGTMTVSLSPNQVCEGHPSSAGSIVIEYAIPQGVQRFYHFNPGVQHRGAKRTAFIPGTVDGYDLLKRLKYAFRQGLTFTIGTSCTSGKTNAVTWGAIPHKTSLSGGSSKYGFPDPAYFAFCNMKLDALLVPPACRLP